MKLLLSGATGAAGSQIFRTALADPDITHITVLARRAIPPWLLPSTETKSTQVILLSDFESYSKDAKIKLAEHDACIWALGTWSVGISEREYTRITHDYVVFAVQALRDGGIAQSRTASPFRFVFISGASAAPDKPNLPLFARVKGRVEKYLTTLPVESNIKASVCRPGYFFPSQPELLQNTRGAVARAFDVLATPAFRTLWPSRYTPIEDMGRFAIGLAKGKWSDETTFSNVRMKELVATITCTT